MFVYKHTITVNQVNYLRSSIGFTQIHKDQVLAGLKGSALIVSVYKEDSIIGMARLIWDGGTVASIHDVIVLNSYRHHSIEEKMISKMIAFLKSNLKPGYGIQIDVKVWSHQYVLYENLDFMVSLDHKRGKAMHKCINMFE